VTDINIKIHFIKIIKISPINVYYDSIVAFELLSILDNNNYLFIINTIHLNNIIDDVLKLLEF